MPIPAPTLQFPTIRVHGSPAECGRRLGEQARRLIGRNIELYADLFRHYAGWDWPRVTKYAAGFRRPIADYEPRYLAEIEGIAAGAGVSVEDILALNVRTEIMFAAVARQAGHECSAFALLPAATVDGHTLIGQNWDWHPGMRDTLIVLHVQQDSGPDYVTVVEAGLLAKMGYNAAGIGVAANALISDQDRGEPGVPFHVVLRGLLDAETMTQALAAINRQARAASANYLVAHRDGEAFNAETAPGDYTRVYADFATGDMLVHTNHFVSPCFDLHDVGLWNGPDSPFRYTRLTHLLRTAAGTLDAARLQTILADHFNRPHSICRHPDSAAPAAEQYATVASVIMDLTAGTMWLADGNPCEVGYREVGMHV
jgi:isopenicillin-N N-acyltransferase-like protein